jgi:hypothetical protein
MAPAPDYIIYIGSGSSSSTLKIIYKGDYVSDSEPIRYLYSIDYTYFITKPTILQIGMIYTGDVELSVGDSYNYTLMEPYDSRRLVEINEDELISWKVDMIS